MKRKLKHVLVRFPIFLLMWIINIGIKIPTILLGFLMVALLYKYRKRPFDEVPKVFLPWQNPEDWNDRMYGTENSLPEWWVKRMGGDGFWPFYKYHAIRNPANGLRNFDFIDLDLKEGEIEYWTPEYLRHYAPWFKDVEHNKTYIYVAWQGWKAGIDIMHIWNSERYFTFIFGWRVCPRDAVEGYDEKSHRWKLGAGFASKFLPYRKM